MVQFVLENLPYVIFVAVGVIVAIISFVVNLVNGKSVKSSVDQLIQDLESVNEVSEDMKYRTADYQQKKGVKKVAQSFTPFRDVYVRNKVTGELEKQDQPINVDELVKSSADKALSEVLDKLLPSSGNELDGDVSSYYAELSELDFMTEAYEMCEDYRERYNLSDKLTFSQVLERVEAENKKSLEALKSKLKGGVTNAQAQSADNAQEKEVIETNEQTNV